MELSNQKCTVHFYAPRKLVVIFTNVKENVKSLTVAVAIGCEDVLVESAVQANGLKI